MVVWGWRYAYIRHVRVVATRDKLILDLEGKNCTMSRPVCDPLPR